VKEAPLFVCIDVDSRSAEAWVRLDGVYDSVARLIGVVRDEIALTENATVAWQMAFYALPLRAGDRILTARAEYAANYVAFLQVAKRTGAVIEVIPDDANGVLRTEANDLETVNWEDPAQRDAWIEIHYEEHRNWAGLLKI